MSRIQRRLHSRLNLILPGKLLKIREGLYQQLPEREWIFNRVEDNSVYLIDKKGAYGVVVRMEDINWNEY